MNAGRLDTHLEHASLLPRGLVAHARHLAALNQALQQWLAPQDAWAEQVRIANYRAPQVTLIIGSAAIATPLRYRQQDLLDWLGEQTGQRFSRLEISIRALPGQHRVRV